MRELSIEARQIDFLEVTTAGLVTNGPGRSPCGSSLSHKQKAPHIH
jgi:hypothetical protein